MYAGYIYFEIYGIPLIVYFGIFTVIFLILTISVPLVNKRMKKKIPLRWHYSMAALAAFFALLHVISAILVRL
ncbi:MAG: hypothetical protein JW931_07405 [Methanomicrobiaceae archaeon]|nr:hypothetical protein [Methanomicrobiaceae archaeon]